MLVAYYCRNYLSKWYLNEAQKANIDLSDNEARQYFYKMPYSHWKQAHQLPATKA
jgi:hypothetical protein